MKEKVTDYTFKKYKMYITVFFKKSYLKFKNFENS